jgi:hypothetical protein
VRDVCVCVCVCDVCVCVCDRTEFCRLKRGYFFSQLTQLIRKQVSFVCNKQLFIANNMNSCTKKSVTNLSKIILVFKICLVDFRLLKC